MGTPTPTKKRLQVRVFAVIHGEKASCNTPEAQSKHVSLMPSTALTEPR
jgi:hypothetical protein